jgi:dCMP deaminase
MNQSTPERPGRHIYFMGIAQAVRERADCRGQKVGAVIVFEDRIVSTGYNGTPSKMRNCSDGGCHRCANRDKAYKSGSAYDLCICVHAEQNAILSAARFGISVQSGTIYSTTQPCFGCLKEMLQARIDEVYFLHPWLSGRDAEQERQYKGLQDSFPHGVHPLEMADPRAEWAKGKSGTVTISDEHGMETP